MPIPSARQLEHVLTGVFGTPVVVEQAERQAPWSVARCTLAPSSASLPRSVMAKWVRDDPRGARADPRLLATERAALEFLAQIGFALAPRLIAADLAAGFLVMEDLSPCLPLADLIRRDGSATLSQELFAFARAMGELGAASAGKSATYDRIRALYGPLHPLAGQERGLGPGWPDAQRRLADLGLAMSDAVQQDLAAAVDTLLNPGPFSAFSNGDPETNNFMIAGTDGRLIDFEGAAFQHALTCAVWIHVPGPAWITVAQPICADLERAYRQALCLGVPEADDDYRFGQGLAAAALIWTLGRLGRFGVLDARAPGEASRIQMISTLEAAAGVGRRHRALPSLSGWAEVAAGWLRRRWPDADVDLALYPAYAPRA